MTKCSNRKGDRLKKDAPRRRQEQESDVGEGEVPGGGGEHSTKFPDMEARDFKGL